LWKGSKSTNDAKIDVLVNDAADINVGVDYKLNKKWAIWLDLNNIANAQYQRWNQYDSYGFNLVGGIRYSFLNKKPTKK
jgi:outer membrane receptor protein involved in Fe transport